MYEDPAEVVRLDREVLFTAAGITDESAQAAGLDLGDEEVEYPKYSTTTNNSHMHTSSFFLPSQHPSYISHFLSHTNTVSMEYTVEKFLYLFFSTK